MWYLCCVCLPPVFVFSPPVHSALYQRAAASHSVYRHTSRRAVRRYKTKHHDMCMCTHLHVSDLPVLIRCLGLTIVLILDRLQTQVSVDAWQRRSHSLRVPSLCVSILKKFSMRSAYLPPWCGPACSPAAPPEALGTQLPGLPPLPTACCSPDWAARDTACTQTRLRLKLQLKSSDRP